MYNLQGEISMCTKPIFIGLFEKGLIGLFLLLSKSENKNLDEMISVLGFQLPEVDKIIISIIIRFL
jgi:hypothetical protein